METVVGDAGDAGINARRRSEGLIILGVFILQRTSATTVHFSAGGWRELLKMTVATLAVAATTAERFCQVFA